MRSTHDDRVNVFEVHLQEHPNQLQERLFRTLFKDRCSKCNLPSYIEIEAPTKTDLSGLKQDIGLACGFWLARKNFAELLCAEFESQFEMKTISDDACFLVLKNVQIPDDQLYQDAGDCDPFFSDKERICSQCGRPYILLHKGFISFEGGNRIRKRTVYETSLKFGTADVKYPIYLCDGKAKTALEAISRRFKFVSSRISFSLEAT